MSRKTKMNHITSPELIQQINPDNVRLKDDFLDYLRSIQRSSGTISGYSNDLDIFFVWVLEHAKNKPFSEITKRDIIAYQSWLINNNQNSPSRVRRLKAAISSLSNYVESILDDEPEFKGFRSIVKKIENPALQPVREKTVWSDEDVENILFELMEKGKIEMACFVALGVYSGRRKAELCRFRVSDFDASRLVCDGALYKSAPILTKGNKMLECYTLAQKFQPYLDAWMKKREEDNIDSTWLFPNPADMSECLNISTANSWADYLTRMTGRDFYFHALRHHYCSFLIRAGIPDSVIVDIVGWSSAEMLKIYNDNPKDDRLSMYFTKDGIVAGKQKDLSDL